MNIDDILPEFELISNTNNGSSNFSTIFSQIEAEQERLSAKKHFFAVLSVANQIEQIIKETGISTSDIECVSFSEHEYSNDNYCLSATIETSENGDMSKTAQMEMQLNDILYVLGDPKFFFFSDAASDEMDDNDFFEIPNNIETMPEAFIEKSLNSELFEIYKMAKIKTDLENNLEKGSEFKNKKIKM